MVVTKDTQNYITSAQGEGVKDDKNGVCLTSILIPDLLAKYHLFFFLILEIHLDDGRRRGAKRQWEREREWKKEGMKGVGGRGSEK